jgi:Glycosyl hydrolases family 43
MGGADRWRCARRPRYGCRVVALYGALAVLLLMEAGAVVVADARATTTPAAKTTAAKTATIKATTTPNNQPPVTSDPATPGTWISTGPDETDPFMVVQDRHYDLFTSSEGLYFTSSEELDFTSSEGLGANIPVRTAIIPGQWGPVSDALPVLPTWAEPGWAWAPDVQPFGDRDVLYFTTLLRGSSPPTMCIGDAVGARIIGPYVAQPAPLVCQTSLGGSIDPRTFVSAKGTAYLLWKSDENAVSQTTDTRIYSEPLSVDGLHLLGQPTQIFGPDESWQGSIVEAPQLMQVEGAYYLFYSGFWFNQPGYAIGVARCSGPLGPCHDTSPDPLLGSNAQGAGPGEESVFSDAKGIWLLYAPFHSAVPLSGLPRPATVVRLGFGPAGAYVAATPGAPAGI